MQIALDKNETRTHIKDSLGSEDYFCPSCGNKVIQRKGEINRWHFAHGKNGICTDSWEREGHYDDSEWHNEWQSQFPVANREITLIFDTVKHRADILIDKNVVEFQHSPLSNETFSDRNSFYINFGYKVIWLFDMRGEYASNKLDCVELQEDYAVYNWKNARKPFFKYDLDDNDIEVFLQFSDEKDSIVKVFRCDYDPCSRIVVSNFITKEDFLNYVGCRGEKTLLPNFEDTTDNIDYIKFKQKYGLTLNKQQDRAVQAVNGPICMVAVPGSGKTTTLIAKIGYMVLMKNIAPERILAMTYTNAAVKDISERIEELFGKAIASKIKVATINSISNTITKVYCNNINCETISNIDANKIVMNLIHKKKKMASANDRLEIQQMISYAKNMMYEKSQIEEMHSDNVPCKFIDLFNQYNEELSKAGKIDFDDQNRIAVEALSNDAELREKYQRKWDYVLIDEAQDTSFLQHKLIELLVNKNQNIFMVGDEDQSIYGFRAAYPKSLLNFKYNYTNAHMMKLERNYRSAEEIVNVAKHFIRKNTGRILKEMTSDRGPGGSIKKIVVEDRNAQLKYLVNVASQCNNESIILYRDNECALPLKDQLVSLGIPFQLLNNDSEKKFLGNYNNREVLAYLRLAVNPLDTESFKFIVKKFGDFRDMNISYAIEKSEEYEAPILETFGAQMDYWKKRNSDYPACYDAMKRFFDELVKLSPARAIQSIFQHKLAKKDDSVWMMLARPHKTLAEFVEHMDKLEESLNNHKNDEKGVVLSTIHSAKGLEFKNVYFMDCVDGILPTEANQYQTINRNSSDNYQEERRMFYVGITRAKDNLYLIKNKANATSFIDEIITNNVEKVDVNALEIKIQDYLTEDYVLPKKTNEKQFSAEPRSIKDIALESDADAIIVKNVQTDKIFKIYGLDFVRTAGYKQDIKGYRRKDNGDGYWSDRQVVYYWRSPQWVLIDKIYK